MIKRTLSAAAFALYVSVVPAYGMKPSDPDEEAKLLLRAVHAKDVEEVARLIESGLNAGVCDSKGITALHLLADSSELDARAHQLLSLILSKKPDLNPAIIADTHNRGKTPLHMAVVRGNYECAKLLLESGADVNARTRNGGTSLHIAANWGHLPIAELLLAHKVDVNAVTMNDGVNNHVDEGWPALYFAIDKGHSAFVKLLLKHGARVDIVDKRGAKAIHIAAGKEHTVKMVTIQEQPISTTNAVSPVQLLYNGPKICPEIVDLVRKRDPEVSTKNNEGFTALDYARTCKCNASVALLSDLTVDLCAQCEKTGTFKACGGCKTVRYCSVQCQKKSWPEHKKFCSPQ